MREYSVWVDEVEKIASFHEVDNSAPMYFEQHETFLDYLSLLTARGYHTARILPILSIKSLQQEKSSKMSLRYKTQRRMQSGSISQRKV